LLQNNAFMRYLMLFLKGLAMGAANVIPGVSGGTIALITGIFHELIDSIKSFNGVALKLLLSAKFKELIVHINLWFLISVFGGIGVSIISFARIFGYLFEYYPVYLWAFFFGLILISVFYVAKTVTSFSITTVLFFVLGTSFAVGITFFNPATENDAFWYLIVCGIVAMISMILPGLSGSFVLILLGNYQLVMIDAVNNLSLKILIPVALGAAGGILAFSHILSWILKKYYNQTIALLAGFILGSLSTIWPWKNAIYMTNADGSQLLKRGEPVILTYEKFIPDAFSGEVVLALLFMVLGAASIILIEYLAEKSKK